MSKQNMMVFGYARVSTDNQLENYSIEEQSSRLKSYCDAKGWTLLHIYIDGGYSGGNTNRPALKQMLADLQNNEIDAVVVYKLDRLSRSQKDTLTLIEDEFLSNHTDFVSINENFDTSTPFGRAMIGMLSVFAQLEKDQITERFTMGRIGRGKAGYFHGGGNAPTGYDYIDGKLVVNDYEAIQVRLVFERFLNGKSINAIWQELSSAYETKWSAAKVRNVLKNSLYVGKVKFSGQEYAGAHSPIVDEGVFNMANQILNSSSREEKKTTAQKNPFRAGYLLSGLVYCGRCGARYSANHGYYKCYSRAKSSVKFIIDPDCRNEHWKIENLDFIVSNQVDSLVSNQVSLDALISSRAPDKTVHVDKAKLLKKCALIDSQIERLIELYQVGAIPMESITKKVNTLSAQREAFEQQLQSPENIPAKDALLSAIEMYKNGFNDGDIDKKRSLLSAMIERVVLDGDNVSIQWRF